MKPPNAMMLVVGVMALAARPPSSAAADDERTADAGRLPGDTVPESYDLWFDVVGRSPGTFAAVARITATVARAAGARAIAVNARGLAVTDVTVTDAGGPRPAAALPVLDWTVSARDERLVVVLNGTAARGARLVMTVRYAGTVRTDGTGLHRTGDRGGGGSDGGGGSGDPDDDDDDDTGRSVVTQFKPTYARRAFPCYDEPSYKATFSITVVKKKDQIALSNMPIKKTDSRKNTDVVHFETTPPMSTYSVALFVGDLEAHRGNDSRVTVYARKDLANQTELIVAEASRHLDALSEYTGVGYALPELNLLAVPDPGFESTGYWGLNIYREDSILLDEQSKTEAKVRASETVRYELAHQWFGDSVTCSWWDYAWLNDGFAQYFQFFGTNTVNENWPTEERFVVEIHQGALAYDQSSRRPITSAVRTTDEIEGVFDDATRKKSACVLRMLRCLVTEDLFRKSVGKYLSDFKEQTANPNDLYDRFDSVLDDYQYRLNDGLTVREFMSDWTLQTGYPVLNITKDETLNAFLVKQSRFVIESNEIDSGSPTTWHVGLTYTTESEKNFHELRPYFWTNESSKLIQVPALNAGWYIFNIQSSGFYRVNYDVDNWNALVRQLNEAHDDIHVLNRAQLIDDAFGLARAGYLDYSVPLDLSEYLKNENDPTPWYSAINSFTYLIERMPRTKEGFKSVKTYFSELAGPVYGKLDRLVSDGNDDFNVTKAWDALSTWACRLENTYCVDRALEYFEKWKSERKIPADIKDAAFCAGVKNSTDSSIFDTMFDLYTKTNSISEKTSIEWALGCSSNRTQLNEYVNHILDGAHGPINERNYRSVITAISATPLGLDVLYDFLSTNLNAIVDQLCNGEEIAKFIYDTLATKITNDDEIEKIRNMKNDPTTPVSLRSSFEKSFEKAIDNRMWFTAYADGIVRWVTKNDRSDPTTKTSSNSVESPNAPVSERPVPSTAETTLSTDEYFTTTAGSEESSSSTPETTWTTDEYFTTTAGSEESPSSTPETTLSTDEYFTTTAGSEASPSSTPETTWTTDEYFTTTAGSEEPPSSTSDAPRTTDRPSTTPVASGSSYLHCSFTIILVFTTVLANA